MGSLRTHYDNLQVARNASPEVIRAAYKGLTQKYHPDRRPEDRARCERVMKIINEAFAILSDPLKRAEHDTWIAREEASVRPEPKESAAPHQSTPKGDDPTQRGHATNDYANAARAFRESRVASTSRAESQSTAANEPPQSHTTDNDVSRKAQQKHRSLRMIEPTGRETQWLSVAVGLFFTILAWFQHPAWREPMAWGVLGIVALVCGLGLVLFMRQRRRATNRPPGDHVSTVRAFWRGFKAGVSPPLQAADNGYDATQAGLHESTGASARKPVPAESAGRVQHRSYVTWRDWLVGIVGMTCVFAVWPTWDVTGPLALIVGLGLLGWLTVRGLNQHALIEARSTSGDSQTPPAVDEQTKPVSAWVGLGIAAVVVIAIMASMSLRDTRAGRVSIVIGVALLLLTLAKMLARQFRRARESGLGLKKVEGFLWKLMLLVWSAVPFFVGLRPGPGAVSWGTTSIVVVWLAAAIPSYAICRTLLAPPGNRDLTWKAVIGYLFAMILVLPAPFYVRPWEGNPLYQYSLANAHGTGLGLILAHDAGVVLGVILTSAIVALLLTSIGALGGAVIAAVYRAWGRPQPRRRTTALLTGWATIPVLSAVLFLTKWVP